MAKNCLLQLTKPGDSSWVAYLYLNPAWNTWNPPKGWWVPSPSPQKPFGTTVLGMLRDHGINTDLLDDSLHVLASLWGLTVAQAKVGQIGSLWRASMPLLYQVMQVDLALGLPTTSAPRVRARIRDLTALASAQS